MHLFLPFLEILMVSVKKIPFSVCVRCVLLAKIIVSVYSPGQLVHMSNICLKL